MCARELRQMPPDFTLACKYGEFTVSVKSSVAVLINFDRFTINKADYRGTFRTAMYDDKFCADREPINGKRALHVYRGFGSEASNQIKEKIKEELCLALNKYISENYVKLSVLFYAADGVNKYNAKAQLLDMLDEHQEQIACIKKAIDNIDANSGRHIEIDYHKLGIKK